MALLRVREEVVVVEEEEAKLLDRLWVQLVPRRWLLDSVGRRWDGTEERNGHAYQVPWASGWKEEGEELTSTRAFLERASLTIPFH